MPPIFTFMYRFLVCATIIGCTPDALAAVLVLEGAPQPSSPPTSSPPDIPAPRDDPPAPAQSSSPTTAPSDSEILSPGTGTAKVTPPAVATTPPAAASAIASPTDLGTAKVANSAEVSLEMMPGQTVSAGSHVSFRITSKKAGYLVLVDVDAIGHLAQIYPNAASLVRTSRANGNYIKAGGTLTIPLATDPYAGIQYVVSPPTGQAMIVAILSPQPVQILDLPDVPPNVKDKSEMLTYLSKWMSELRIPDDGNQLREAKWSFNAKSYTIQ
jgi:hypothetical protein